MQAKNIYQSKINDGIRDRLHSLSLFHEWSTPFLLDSHSRGVDLDIKDYILPLLPLTRYKRGF